MKAAALRFTAPPGKLPLGAIFGTIGVASAGAIALLRLDHLPFTVCLFKAMTGWPCPACGSTRAVGHLAHADVAGAFAMNPLATAAAVVVAAWAVADAVLLARGRALDLEVETRVGNLMRVGFVVAVALNWAYLLMAGR
jgi:hypothetical protein